MLLPGGGAFNGPVQVTITAPGMPADGVIFYTTDGTAPDRHSPVYSQPIRVGFSEVITAIASAPGCPTAGPTTAAYSIPDALTATPTFTPPGGTFCKPQVVTIQCATAGATILYTLDGTNPNPSSPVYGQPIVVSTTTQIRAVATAPGFIASSIEVGQYAIDPPPPGQAPPALIDPAGGVMNNDFSAALSAQSLPQGGWTLCYTLDGSDPVGADGVCTAPALPYDAATKIAIDGTVTNPATGQVTVKSLNVGTPCPDGCCGIDSAGLSATYTLQVAQPNITPASGKIAVGTAVTFTSATEGTPVFHYTVDGSAASCSSPRTGAGFTATGTESTVNVVGCKSGYAVSATGSASYSF